MFGAWAIGLVGVIVAAAMLSKQGSCSDAVFLAFYLLPLLIARRSSFVGPRCTPSGIISCTISHLMPALDGLSALLTSSPLKV